MGELESNEKKKPIQSHYINVIVGLASSRSPPLVCWFMTTSAMTTSLHHSTMRLKVQRPPPEPWHDQLKAATAAADHKTILSATTI